MNCAARRPSRGFTLVEVLVAVAILAIALSAVIAASARYASNASYLRQKTLALWVAHNRMAEIEIEGRWLSPGKSDQDVEMAGQKWTYEQVISETADEKLRRVDISVSAARDKAVLARLSGFIAQVENRQRSNNSSSSNAEIPR
jgi:general secretion pathway protein I